MKTTPVLLLLACCLSAATAMARPNTAVDPVASEDLAPPEPPYYNVVVLQGLNKVTGHISTFDGLVGTNLQFGTLEIIPRRCWKAPPEERPENAAILDIYEKKPSEEQQRVFLGWMFSSSPGLSGLEHPVYDITLLSCEEAKEAEPEATEEEKPAEKKKK